MAASDNLGPQWTRSISNNRKKGDPLFESHRSSDRSTGLDADYFVAGTPASEVYFLYNNMDMPSEDLDSRLVMTADSQEYSKDGLPAVFSSRRMITGPKRGPRGMAWAWAAMNRIDKTGDPNVLPNGRRLTDPRRAYHEIVSVPPSPERDI